MSGTVNAITEHIAIDNLEKNVKGFSIYAPSHPVCFERFHLSACGTHARSNFSSESPYRAYTSDRLLQNLSLKGDVCDFPHYGRIFFVIYCARFNEFRPTGLQ